MHWREFEKRCVEYLNQEYGSERVKFLHMGEADSTVSDVKVAVDGKTRFFVEIKMAKSQCGQFVVMPDLAKWKYVFSARNKSAETAATGEIIDYLDRHFEKFLMGGVLEIGSEVCFRWIIQHYQAMGTKYMMTGAEGRYLIFPLEKIAEYFTVQAIYRVKRSGSHNPTASQRTEILAILREKVGNLESEIRGDDLVVRGKELTKGQRFETAERTYYLAEHPEGLRVRVLSKTANANVIFVIELKKFTQDEGDLAKFRADLG